MAVYGKDISELNIGGAADRLGRLFFILLLCADEDLDKESFKIYLTKIMKITQVIFFK